MTYFWKEGIEEGKQPFIFHRTVSIDGVDVNVQVDLLSGEYEGTGGSHRHQKIQEGLAKLAKNFASADHTGPKFVTAFEEITDEEDRAQMERDAFERGYYPQRCKSRRASESRRRGCSCNRLPQSLNNAGSEALRLSALFQGEITWQKRPHPLTSQLAISGKGRHCCDIGHNYGPLANLCHIIYATTGLPFAETGYCVNAR